MKRASWIALLSLGLLLPFVAEGAPRLPEPRDVARAVLEVTAGRGELTVYFLDVGQGDAILIVSPERRAVLIDGGPRAGGATVMELLRREGIAALDLVIASHPHLDHIGGLQAVIESVPVRYYMDPGYPHSSRAYERLLESIEKRGVPVLTARAGRRINLGGGAAIEIVSPDEPLYSGTRSDVNANSVIARVQYGSFSVLLTGDAEADTEERVSSWPNIRSTVLKVPHHGSRHSSTPTLLAAVRPEIAVIQVGRNSYGHPHPDTLARLEEFGARVYRNDLHGTLTVTTNGSTYTIKTERWVSAEDDGRRRLAEGEGRTGHPRGPPGH